MAPENLRGLTCSWLLLPRDMGYISHNDIQTCTAAHSWSLHGQHHGEKMFLPLSSKPVLNLQLVRCMLLTVHRLQAFSNYYVINFFCTM